MVKQRLQMYNSPYRSMTHCILSVFRAEGMGAFYRSYGTQLVMNIPFQCAHFVVYEAMQNASNPDRSYNPLCHVVSGGVSGAVAAAVTTPLDVCKTLLNTQVPAVTMETVSFLEQLPRLVPDVFKLESIEWINGCSCSI